jgi:ATP-dependent protease ClpP protease subunit
MSTEQSYSHIILEGLMERRTILLTGEIDEKETHDIRRRLLVLQTRSNEPITLLIDSAGGCTMSALHLCDFMSTLMTAPIRGIALGNCKSAATFIMLHCNPRLGTRYSRFLIHSGSRKLSVSINHTTAEQVEQILQGNRRTEKAILQLYMDRLTPREWEVKRPPVKEQHEFVEGLIKRGDQRFDYIMTAQEALEVGLIQEIVHDKLEIFPA